METPTPETDAATANCHGMPNGYPGRFVSVDLSRKLERQRDEARKQIEELESRLESCKWSLAEYE